MQRLISLFIVICLSTTALGNQNGPDRAGEGKPRQKVFIIPIVNEMDYSMAAFVRRSIGEAKSQKADLIMLEIDTPGGEVFSTLNMCTDIISAALLDTGGITTVAYIRPSGGGYSAGTAWSAGAFISLSCKKIYMYPAMVIGAAAPITMGPDGPKPVEEKMISAIREKVAAIAEQNGYPRNIAIAMVDKDWEVFEVTVDGSKKEYLIKREIEEYEKAGKKLDVPLYPFIAEGKLLTLSVKDAIRCGIAAAEVRSRKEIYARHGIENPIEVEMSYSWSEDLVDIIQGSTVQFILLIVAVVGVWVELKTPGFGVPGIVGILAFAVLVFSSYMVGLAEVQDIVLIVVGFVLIALEIFVIPGFGVTGILGAVALLAGLVLMRVPFVIPKNALELDTLMKISGMTALSIGVAFAIFLVLMKFLPSVPFLNRFVLNAVIGGNVAGDQAGVSKYQGLLDKIGIAATNLRPAGKAEIDGVICDVVAEGGEFIEKGASVKVVEIEGMRIVVSNISHGKPETN